MHILIVNPSVIPVTAYGGTERVIWYLGKMLAALGHTVTYLVRAGSSCPFGSVITIDDTKSIAEQIPANVDLVHFNFLPPDIDRVTKPYIVTIHGNTNDTQLQFPLNTVFVSENHARRFGSDSFVHNGLDWTDYSKPELNAKRDRFHFLANAAWRVKNVQGAIDVIKKTSSEKLNVLGGVRFNFKMGIRFTFSPRVSFYGMIGGTQKDRLLNNSKGLLFPVRWHEPFGLAIVESLYFGAPIFATPYGSLPELVNTEVGFLSNNSAEMAEAVQSNHYSPEVCHEYALEMFNAKKMTLAYVSAYEKVLSGQPLNTTPPRLKESQTEKFLPWH
jgi:glycosyltransferase involved in cell wall biosynthesis